MDWLILTIISGIIFSFKDIIYKNIDYNILDVNMFTACWSSIAGILAFIYIIYNFNKNPKIFNKISYKYYCIVLFTSLLIVSGFILFFNSLVLCKNVELVRSIFSGITIIMVLLYSIYNKVYLKMHQYIGIFLILIGIFLAYNKNLNL